MTNFNSLCWSIGSISGIFRPEIEKNFIISVIKDLLCLADIKKGKDNKAVIASNIMYVVGQYPRFLKNHWKFLKTVIYKLFEFMHETHPGVQDMACDTFSKISKTCAKCILILQDGETRPFFDEMLDSIDKTTKILEYHHIQQLYETLSIIINYCTDTELINYYVSKIFEIVNSIWFNSIKSKITDNDFISIYKTVDLIKLNKKIAAILEKKYDSYIKILYFEFHYLYNWCCEKITHILEQTYACSYDVTVVRYFINLRNEVLSLVECYIKICFSSNYCKINYENFFQIIIPIINDTKIYLSLKKGEALFIKFSIFILKECKFFSDVKVMIIIFEKIFTPALDLIKENFESYPDVRHSFFSLLKIMVVDYFPFIFKLNQDSSKAESIFENIIQSIIWGFKHSNILISKVSLKILMSVFSLANSNCVGQYFCLRYARQILVDLLSMIIDKSHISAMKLQFRVFFELLYEAKKYIHLRSLKEFIESVFKKAFPEVNIKIIECVSFEIINSKLYLEFEKQLKKLVKTTKETWQDDSSEDESDSKSLCC
jgi:exportin-1